MEKHDEQFENYLREFQPRRPRVLPAMDAARTEWRRLAAAAAVLLAIGAGTWLVVHEKRLNPARAVMAPEAVVDVRLTHLTLTRLTRLAFEDTERLDSVLDEASRRMLPGFRGKESTLRVLAKE